jgi:hypothetical protein
MLKKLVLTLSFVFLVIVVMGASCGGGGPSARLGNVSDTSLSLTAEVGASAIDSFTFENTGDATLTYTITETLGFLEITSGASGSVQAGNTATVVFEVTCESQETLNGIITVESNGGDAEIDVEIICTPPTAQLGNLSDTSLSLTAPVGSSTTESFTFENVGQANLTYTTSTNSAFLEVTQGASGTVVPGATATVTLEASCTTEGTFNGNVSVDSNGGDATVAVTLTCTPASASSYDIEVEFFGSGLTDEREEAFTDAAARWAQIIVEDLGNVAALPAPGDLNPPLTEFCDPEEPDVAGLAVDDLLILAKVGAIDGPNGTLAFAGPALWRGSNSDPFQGTALGCMVFDVADIVSLENDGSFRDVVLHEMGHVIGIGTFWDGLGLLDYSPQGGTPCRSIPTANFTQTPSFNGSNAQREFNNLGETGNPPVEDEFGAGTQCGHWDEDFFQTYDWFYRPWYRISLSRMTVGSLEDLGYDVDYAQADPYDLPFSVAPQAETPVRENWEVLLQPKGRINPDGTITSFDR